MSNSTLKRGFFRSALNAIVEARSREAQRMLDAYEAKNGGRAGRSYPAGF